MVASAKAKNNRRKKIKGKSKGKKQDYNNDNENDNDNDNIWWEGVDCLSLLPDDILVGILSRLTVRDTITTSVLSQRWRYLWTQITCLTIIDPHRQKKIFTKVLPKLANIHEVKVLSINASRVSEHTTFLNQIFIQLSLMKVLELDYRGFLLGHSGYELILPTRVNLKVLNLRFDYDGGSYASLLNKLLKSCPLLEDLSLKVNCPLAYSNVMIIDAPKVKYLNLDYIHLSKLLFANIFTLEKVDVSGAFGKLNVDGQSCGLMNIFQVISKARSLSLGSPSLTVDPRMPMFDSLVHLKCIVDCSVEDTINLLTLLSKCTLLEGLILNFTSKFNDLKKHSEILQCDLAPTLLVRLKRVEMNMRVHLLNGGALYTVKYLLASASVLELLIVNATGYKNGFTEVAQGNELQICKDIFALPRKSLLCQVEYFGISLKSSDFERILY